MSGERTMQYNRLGNTGLKVSELSFGSWVTFSNQLDTSKAKELMSLAFDAGINFFDNAEVYAGGKSEIVMGEAIKELGWKRSDLVLSTKIFWGGKGPNDRGLSRKHVIEGTKASLERLQVDYVDVLFCHRPDTETPMEETVRAMNHVIEKGQALYWGTSEWTAQQLQEAWGIADRLGLVGPAVEQPEYSLFARQKVESDFLPLYAGKGLGLTTWSPLASGLLSGKYSKDHVPEGSRFAMEQYKHMGASNLVEEKLSKVDALRPIAESLGCSLAQLSLAWCVSNSNVSTVILGATKPEQLLTGINQCVHLRPIDISSQSQRRIANNLCTRLELKENLKCLRSVEKLTPEICAKIEEIMGNKPKANPSYR